MKIENYIEGAVSLIRNYEEYEDFFYNIICASLITFFVGLFFWFYSRYLGAWMMALSSFTFMISTVCWAVIKIIIKIRLQLKLVGEKVDSSDIR